MAEEKKVFMAVFFSKEGMKSEDIPALQSACEGDGQFRDMDTEALLDESGTQLTVVLTKTEMLKEEAEVLMPLCLQDGIDRGMSVQGRITWYYDEGDLAEVVP
jgi:hypothetical protein